LLRAWSPRFGEGFYDLSDTYSACLDGTSVGTSEGDLAGATDGALAGYDDGFLAGDVEGALAANVALADVELVFEAAKWEFEKCLLAETYVVGGAIPVFFAGEATLPNLIQQCDDAGYNSLRDGSAYEDAFGAAASANTAYQLGLDEGTTDGQLDGDIDGDADGAAAGQSDGSFDGQAAGIAEAEGAAYTECFDVAFAANYASSYDAVYYAEYDVGFDEGRIQGFLDTMDGYYSSRNCVTVLNP